MCGVCVRGVLAWRCGFGLGFWLCWVSPLALFSVSFSPFVAFSVSFSPFLVPHVPSLLVCPSATFLSWTSGFSYATTPLPLHLFPL